VQQCWIQARAGNTKLYNPKIFNIIQQGGQICVNMLISTILKDVELICLNRLPPPPPSFNIDRTTKVDLKMLDDAESVSPSPGASRGAKHGETDNQ